MNKFAGAWTEISEFAGTARSDATAFVMNDKAYVASGSDVDSQFRIIRYSDIYEFDPNSNDWIQRIAEDEIILQSSSAISFVDGNKAYICSGDYNNLISYDPATNELKDLGEIKGMGPNNNQGWMNSIFFVLNDSAFFGLGLGFANQYTDTICLVHLPVPPEKILLSNSTILEDSPNYTLVGSFSTVDTSYQATHSYELINYDDYPDNANFSIYDTNLYANTTDYEIQNLYTILE